MSCKFKYGDKVIVFGYKGTITSIRKEVDEYICTVSFENTTLIPSQMDYKEKHISFQNNDENCCPACGDSWKVSVFNNQTWKDCIRCNKTQEQLLEESKYPPKIKADNLKPVGFPNGDQELLEEFEKIINGGNDNASDDDDDFFTF